MDKGKESGAMGGGDERGGFVFKHLIFSKVVKIKLQKLVPIEISAFTLM